MPWAWHLLARAPEWRGTCKRAPEWRGTCERPHQCAVWLFVLRTLISEECERKRDYRYCWLYTVVLVFLDILQCPRVFYMIPTWTRLQDWIWTCLEIIYMIKLFEISIILVSFCLRNLISPLATSIFYINVFYHQISCLMVYILIIVLSNAVGH